MLDHAITFRDVLVIGGAAFVIVGALVVLAVVIGAIGKGFNH